MNLDTIIVIAKTNDDGYDLAREAGYCTSFTFIVKDQEQANKLQKKYGWEILNEQD